jgi:hypothetical protein
MPLRNQVARDKYHSPPATMARSVFSWERATALSERGRPTKGSS